MANGLITTWQHIRSLLGKGAASSTDANLLAHFIAERDESAFAELVRRHGPMVHGVCRRILSNLHDADDAFQATFLILSRKPTAVRKPDSLSCWLHGVAVRVSRRLKHDLMRRKDRAALPHDIPESVNDDVSWRELRQLVDEELTRLPSQLREPLILCYLEGKTRDEAAEQLGWSLSTFRGRLERGRERLRWRLEKRGLTLSAALLATLAARNAEAAIPLATSTSAQAAALATEVMRTMFLGKLKTALFWSIVVLFLSVGIGATAYRYVAGESCQPGATDSSQPKTKELPTPPENDGLVKDYQAHLDLFDLLFVLKPQEDDKEMKHYWLRQIRLYVGKMRFEPPVAPAEAQARITKEQAAKIIDLLVKDNFFRDSLADTEQLKSQKGYHALVAASYGKKGEKQLMQRWCTMEWNFRMVRQLELMRECVDGHAAKLLDQMLTTLEEERWRWEKSELLAVQKIEDLDSLVVLKDGIAVAKDQLPQRVGLTGVLPLNKWPETLTEEQARLRDEAVKLAKHWLEQHTIEFRCTRSPDFGEAVRYTYGLTKVEQEWKGQLPAERYATQGFHLNVLLIQEGYSPFVRGLAEAWDKKTIACYESAERYAVEHKKGIWKDPAFAARLRRLADKWDGRPDSLAQALRLEDMLGKLPPSREVTCGRFELANLYRRIADEQDRQTNDASTDKDQATKDRLKKIRDHARQRAIDEYEKLLTTIEGPETADHLDGKKKRDVYYYRAYTLFQTGKFKESLAGYERMAKRYKETADYWTAIAGMVSAYMGIGDVQMVRKGIEEIRTQLPLMDTETRQAMEKFVLAVEKALAAAELSK